jgi:hypothetical protein
VILWNISGETIDTKFDGQPYIFEPNGRKTVYDPIIVNHLIYKLEDFGLVSIPDGTVDEKSFEVEGIRKRRGMLDFRVRNYRTMNKEREAAKLSPEPPSEIIIQTVDEIERLDSRLKELRASDFSKVEKYLKSQEAEDTVTKMEEQTSSLETDGTKMVIKKGKGNAVHTASDKGVR